MEKQVLSLENHIFNLAHNIATLPKVDFYNRWHMMTTHLHHVGAMLNPYLLDDLIIHEDVAGKSKFLNAMRKLTTCIDSHYDRVVVKFQVFEEHRGAFANIYAPSHRNKHSTLQLFRSCGQKVAHTWYIGQSVYWSEFVPLRCANWKNYSFVHNKTKNQLSSTRTENLVYIYTNAQLV